MIKIDDSSKCHMCKSKACQEIFQIYYRRKFELFELIHSNEVDFDN